MIDNVDLSGIPIQLIIGFVCYLLAFLFWVVWPKSKAAAYKRINWPKYILRNFHSLAWFLLGTAAMFQENQPVTAVILAALGGFVYVIFVIILMKA